MHQSPQKKLAKRRDKYADLELIDGPEEPRLYRDSQPVARKSALRDEFGREPRTRNHSDKQSLR